MWIPEPGERVFITNRVRQSNNGAEDCADHYGIVDRVQVNYVRPYVILNIIDSPNKSLNNYSWAIYIKDLDPVIINNKMAKRGLKR